MATQLDGGPDRGRRAALQRGDVRPLAKVRVRRGQCAVGTEINRHPLMTTPTSGRRSCWWVIRIERHELRAEVEGRSRPVRMLPAGEQGTELASIVELACSREVLVRAMRIEKPVETACLIAFLAVFEGCGVDSSDVRPLGVDNSEGSPLGTPRPSALLAPFAGNWEFDFDKTIDAQQAAGAPKEDIERLRKIYSQNPQFGKLHADMVGLPAIKPSARACRAPSMTSLGCITTTVRFAVKRGITKIGMIPVT